jgi:hypothetical protein
MAKIQPRPICVARGIEQATKVVIGAPIRPTARE